MAATATINPNALPDTLNLGEALVLGIETSCDETAAAVVRRSADGAGTILSNVVRSQWEEHRPFGGVVPEIAARAHIDCIDEIVRQALADAGIGLAELDAIAATAGPGLIGGLLVGLTTGKALAHAGNLPLLAINHLEAHALTAGLTDGLRPPYLLLLISGGPHPTRPRQGRRHVSEARHDHRRRPWRSL